MATTNHKIIFLTALGNPLFEAELATLKSQCAFLNAQARRLNLSAVGTFTPAMIRRWRREGVRAIDPTGNFYGLCTILAERAGMLDMADKIAHDAIDRDVSLHQFARLFNVEGIESEFVVADLEFTRSFPALTNSLDTLDARTSESHDAFGLYKLERLAASGGDGAPSTCLLAVYKKLIHEGGWALFVKLYVPTQGRRRDRFFEYSGVSVLRNGGRYFFLQMMASERPDFVLLVTDTGGHPVERMSGLYVSINIEQLAGPSFRNVQLERIDDSVSDRSIAQARRSIDPR